MRLYFILAFIYKTFMVWPGANNQLGWHSFYSYVNSLSIETPLNTNWYSLSKYTFLVYIYYAKALSEWKDNSFFRHLFVYIYSILCLVKWHCIHHLYILYQHRQKFESSLKMFGLCLCHRTKNLLALEYYLLFYSILYSILIIG
jgi:hypothetical protein